MRLIDADAFLKRNEVYADCEFIHPMYQNTLREIVDDEPTITAPRWHRVEEPPKKHGKYLVCYVEQGEFYWEEAHYCFYPDGDKWTAWSSYQDDDVEITPDYWMPIEPPKEDI